MHRGDILKLAMAQAHVNQRELADELGINEVSVNRYLSGFRKINDELFNEFVQAINKLEKAKNVK